MIVIQEKVLRKFTPQLQSDLLESLISTPSVSNSISRYYKPSGPIFWSVRCIKLDHYAAEL